jgi:hypothetical protein
MDICVSYEKKLHGNELPEGGWRHPTRDVKDSAGRFQKIEPVLRGQERKRFMQKLSGDLTWAQQMRLKLHFTWLETKKPDLFNNIQV